MELRDKATFFGFRLSRLLLLFLWVHVISFFFISTPSGLLHNSIGTLWIVLGFVAVQKNYTGVLLLWGIVQLIGLALVALMAATAAVVALILTPHKYALGYNPDLEPQNQPVVGQPAAAGEPAVPLTASATYVERSPGLLVVGLVLFLGILYYMLNLWACVLTFRLRRTLLCLRAEEQQRDEEMQSLVAQEQATHCQQPAAAVPIIIAQQPTPATATTKGVTPAPPPMQFAPGQQVVYLPPEYAQYLAMGGAGAQPMFVVAPMMMPPTTHQ